MNYYNPYYNLYSNQLNGKMVDSIEIVKMAEVPIGGYGIYPKADFSEIYVKSWNPNGSTNVSTFKPVSEEKPVLNSQSLIIEKLDQLEKKIEEITLNKEKEEDKASVY